MGNSAASKSCSIPSQPSSRTSPWAWTRADVPIPMALGQVLAARSGASPLDLQHRAVLNANRYTHSTHRGETLREQHELGAHMFPCHPHRVRSWTREAAAGTDSFKPKLAPTACPSHTAREVESTCGLHIVILDV